MIIRGFPIPDLLTSMLLQGSLRREQGSWQLRTEMDHYGQHLETELGFVHPTPGAIEQATTRLPDGFPTEEASEPDDFAGQPGYIPYITDFTAIIEFGISGDGSPFCLDYREDSARPSIIWWDDVYWRRLAPTFEEFISLFDLSES
jgi:hypothetical protein